MSERIAKYLSRAGACSRRDAERHIAAGLVQVNGVVIDNPATFVTDQDVIVIGTEPVAIKEPTRLWLYHKPTGLVTSHGDPEGRPTVFDALPDDLPRVISVGRLDLNSEGLLLLTNDGGLARHLELPEHGWTRRYRVRMRGTPDADMLRQLKRGVTIDEVQYRGIGVTLDSTEAEKHNRWAVVTLQEGKNREIRRVFEHFGHPVSRLIRVAYGPFQLGNLPASEVKMVTQTMLRNALGNGYPL